MPKPRRIRITPAPEPVPYDLSDEPEDTLEEFAHSAMTADLLEKMGARIDISDATAQAEKRVLESAVKQGKVKPLRSSLPASLASYEFLKAYGERLAIDMAQVRTALTHKLLELADCGDPKFELRAIELLGKHSDIGLFTERSEININYNSPEALERAIRERVKRLLNADVIDEIPLGMDLEEELGIHDADFEEVVDEPEELADGDEEATGPDGLDPFDDDADWPEEWVDDDRPQPR